MLFVLSLLACWSTPHPWSPPSAPHVPSASTSVTLARRVPERIALAPTTRPEGSPDAFSPVAPFRRGQTSPEGVTVWEAPLPVDFHVFLERGVGARSFGNWAPQGLVVSLDGTPLPFVRGATRPGSFGYDPETLYVGLPAGTPAPRPDQVQLVWPRATAAERALHFATSERTAAEFLRRTVVLGTTSHTGLLLPAPSRADWIVQVPEGGVLAARARILPPAIASDRPSDGASLEVGISEGASRQVVHTATVGRDWTTLRVDLSAWAGKEVGLSLATTSADPHLDLVFVEDPAVYTPRSDPSIVVLAFVDTVRADHLGMYGYERPTTPRLDRWAATGVRFDQARTVAPWTLPSTLAALTGAVPEEAPGVPTLADRLAEAGFATTGIVANAYLSQVFGTHRGFGRYDYQVLQPAAQTVDQALEVLGAWPGRDQLVLVQFMEAHLPYREPAAYRSLFAGAAPEGHGTPLRVRLVRVGPDQPDFDAVRTYVTARYDQNLRVLDDEVGRLFESLPDHAVTVLFADHGEELWDHGGFEHGHTFHDELLRVPFVVRAPGLTAGSVSTPVSLLDLTPTVLDLLGLPPTPGAHGRSVLPLARGEGADALAARPHGFGHPLYGDDGWGVVDAGHKWSTRGGTQTLYDLAQDPEERVDRSQDLDLAPYPRALEQAVGRAVPAVWRVSLAPVPAATPVTLTLSHPQGLTAVWAAYDPKGLHGASTVALEEGQAVITQPANARMPPVLYVQPAGDAELTEGLTLTLVHEGQATLVQAGPLAPADGGRRRLALAPTGRWRLAVDLVHVPVPGTTSVDAWSDELEDQLRELGYVDEEDDDP